MNNLKQVCFGYLQVGMTGHAAERFLNLCVARKLTLWNLSWEAETCQFLVTVKDFKLMKPLVRKTQVHLKILGRYGLPFFLYRNRKRKAYLAGIILFFGLLFVLSEFIWKISFEGNQRFTEDELTSYLAEQNICYGMWKRNVACEELEDSLRSHYPEITWVSAHVSGTHLVVRIRENEVSRFVGEPEYAPCDLVSEKAGMITRLMVRSGTAVIEPGMEIEKGQMLVSGQIPIIDDSGEIIRYQMVCADADIWAKTEGGYQEQIPSWIRERTFTGKKRYGIRIQVGRVSAAWIFPKIGDQLWEYQTERKQLVFLHDFYLPIWYEPILAKEYSCYERKWKQQELEEQIFLINQKKIDHLQKKGVQIIENNVRILDKCSYWEIDGSFVLEEPIGIQQTINQTEELE